MIPARAVSSEFTPGFPEFSGPGFRTSPPPAGRGEQLWGPTGARGAALRGGRNAVVVVAAVVVVFVVVVVVVETI